ncbi:Putative ankyrin repeat protein FPV162 [Araneus ventricosus]|uniref:Ankyrin repeat protein FPV162 n=1 Tax=Araneus ventricosus TaxID=182803 RepID=A0A4Y2KI06_ARAVE|nr:Putative ankyrin repeat protein FPV162 [Araneus ventricosus]
MAGNKAHYKLLEWFSTRQGTQVICPEAAENNAILRKLMNCEIVHYYDLHDLLIGFRNRYHFDYTGHTKLHLHVKHAQADPNTVRLHLDKDAKANVNARTGRGYTPLHLAALNIHEDKLKQVEVAKELLNFNSDVNAMCYCLMTPLMLAILPVHTNIDLIHELVSFGANVNPKFPISPLRISVSIPHDSRVTKVLLGLGANVHGSDKNFPCSVIRSAFLNPACEVDRFQMLIESGADVNEVDLCGRTLLHYLVGEIYTPSSVNDLTGYEEKLYPSGWEKFLIDERYRKNYERDQAVAEHFLKIKANVNVKDMFGQTPLHCAVKNQFWDSKSIKMLLRCGADVNAVCKAGFTPLLLAVQVVWSNESVVKELMRHGARPDIKDKRGVSALRHVLRNPINNTASMLKLIKQLTSPENSLEGEEDVLLEIVEKKNCPPDMIEHLVKIGADVNAKNSADNTPLDIVLKDLLKHEVDDRTPCDSILSSLATSLSPHYTDLIYAKELLKNGATIKERDLLYTLIIAVSVGCNLDLVKILLERRANAFEKQPILQNEIMHIALQNPQSSTEIFELLILHGARVNAKDRCGRTPLHYSVAKFYEWTEDNKVTYEENPHNLGWEKIRSNQNHPENFARELAVLEMLLKAGADINAKDIFDQTALHYAVKNRNCTPNIIKLLLKNGAHVNSVCKAGLTPLQMAVQVMWSNADIVVELLQNGANPNVKDRRGVSILRHVARNPFGDLKSKTVVVKELLRAKASVREEENILFDFVRNECCPPDIIEQLLVDFDSDLNATDLDNVTILDIALKDPLSKMDVITILLKHGVHSAMSPHISAYMWLQALERVFLAYESSKENKVLDFLKLALKYALFQEPDLRVNSILGRSEVLHKYVKDCEWELAKLSSHKLSCGTMLLHFMKNDDDICCEQSTVEEVTEIMNSNYPLYSDIALKKIDKLILFDELL